jgi:hypothetical protein
MELLDQMVIVRPLRDRDELVRLNVEANRDDHVAILPTDIKPLQHNSVFAVPLKTSKKTAH